MANGIDFSAAIGYKDYVETFADDLFTQIFFGFKSGQLATAHEGVKGKHILTELEIADNLARRWQAAYRGFTNTSYTPTVLEVVRNTVEHSVIPQEFESSYMGMMRKKGQSPTDYPFQAYVMQKLVTKLRAELEVAFWQGDAADAPDPADLLKATFDGILTRVADLITATSITPVATGAITQADVIEQLRAMWDAVDPAYKEAGTDIFVSFSVYDMYRRAYKDTFGSDPAYQKVEGSDYQGIVYELTGGSTMIHPMPGMGTSQRIVITPRANLHYGFDALEDWSNFKIEQNHRQLDFWMDFNFGVTMTQARDGILIVNEQA